MTTDQFVVFSIGPLSMLVSGLILYWIAVRSKPQ